MKKNMGGLDRALRALVLAPVAIATAIPLGPTSVGGIALLLFAGLMLVTAGTGFCPLYLPLGIDTRPTADRSGAPAAPKPNRIWWGLVFLALGALGILQVVGVLDWSSTVGDWWPVAIIGWALAEMLTVRRFSATAAIVAAVGFGLLADEQDWTGRGIIWSAVFVAIGVAILSGGRSGQRRRTAPSASGAPLKPDDVETCTVDQESREAFPRRDHVGVARGTGHPGAAKRPVPTVDERPTVTCGKQADTLRTSGGRAGVQVELRWTSSSRGVRETRDGRRPPSWVCGGRRRATVSSHLTA